MLPTEKAERLPDLSLRIMLRVLEEEKHSTRGMLDAAGLPDGLPALPGEVTATQEAAAQSAFVEATGYRPDLWLRTGLRYHLPSYGGLGMALMTSETLAQMLETSRDSRELDYSLGRASQIYVRGALVGQEFDASGMPDTLAEFTIYRDVGATLMALGDVWRDSFPVQRVEFAMPKPENMSFDLFGYEVIFGAERNAVVWEAEHSRHELRYADPVLHAAYLEQCQIKVRVRDTRDELVSLLEAQLTEDAEAPLSLARLAALNGQSERTLQRRLLARGVRFRDIADEARRRVAIHLIQTTQVPIAEVAWRVGYSEATSFNHAFRRWTGVNPATLRRRFA